MGAWHVHGDQFLAKGCAGRAVFKICAAYFKLGQVLRVAAKMAFDSSPIIAVTQEATQVLMTAAPPMPELEAALEVHMRYAGTYIQVFRVLRLGSLLSILNYLHLDM